MYWPRKLKIWLALFALFVSVLIVIAIVSDYYAKGIILSLFRGEIAILYWVAHAGFSQKKAVLITILLSTLSIANYFWCGDQVSRPIGRFLRKKSAQLKTLLEIQAGTPVVRKQANTVCDGKFRKLARKFPYCVLPVYNFDPFFGVLAAIVFAKSCKLNIKITFAIICAGNAAEKIIWSYFIQSAQHLIQEIVIPMVYLSLGIVIAVSLFRFLYAEDDSAEDTQ